jgi:hypothetical protein
MSEEDKQGKNRRFRVVFEEQVDGGSDGFYGNDKIPLDNGERYQLSVIMTRIGSKPKDPTKKE